MSATDRIVVTIDPDLEDIAPGYLDNRRNELPKLRQMLAERDFENLKILGHRMKGSGAGYGFDPITEFGRHIEDGARRGDGALIQSNIDALETYLSRVDIIFGAT
ncbi:MAG: Hpt domain-containing protein [Magnetococcus sp. WYHC-3]